MNILIDAGHGFVDGKPDGVAKNGIVEDTLALQMALHVMMLCEGSDYNINPILSRTENDQKPSLKRRAEIADENECGFAVSIHINAHEDQRVWGPTAFYMPNDVVGRSAAMRFLNSTGRDGDYVSGAGGVLRRTRSPFASRREHWTQRAANVMRPYKMPVYLAEIGYATNRHDAEWLQKPSSQREIAVAVFASLIRAQTLLELGALNV